MIKAKLWKTCVRGQLLWQGTPAPEQATTNWHVLGDRLNDKNMQEVSMACVHIIKSQTHKDTSHWFCLPDTLKPQSAYKIYEHTTIIWWIFFSKWWHSTVKIVNNYKLASTMKCRYCNQFNFSFSLSFACTYSHTSAARSEIKLGWDTRLDQQPLWKVLCITLNAIQHAKFSHLHMKKPDIIG